MKSPLTRFALLLITFLALVASGCQTSQGIGEDVENLGEEIQDAAD